MAKKKVKDIITEDGHIFDSMEELYFYWWVKELKDNGYILGFIPQPEPFVLSKGLHVKYIKEMKKVPNKELAHTLIEPSSYTADGLIRWADKAFGLFVTNLDGLGDDYTDESICKDKKLLNLLISDFSFCYIEVKPIFDQNNMTRLARTNIKWVHDNTGRVVNLVIPQKLFAKTFTPKRYLTCDKSSQKRKIHFKVQSLQEFENKNKNNQLGLL